MNAVKERLRDALHATGSVSLAVIKHWDLAARRKIVLETGRAARNWNAVSTRQ